MKANNPETAVQSFLLSHFSLHRVGRFVMCMNYYAPEHCYVMDGKKQHSVSKITESCISQLNITLYQTPGSSISN